MNHLYRLSFVVSRCAMKSGPCAPERHSTRRLCRVFPPPQLPVQRGQQSGEAVHEHQMPRLVRQDPPLRLRPGSHLKGEALIIHARRSVYWHAKAPPPLLGPLPLPPQKATMAAAGRWGSFSGVRLFADLSWRCFRTRTPLPTRRCCWLYSPSTAG